MSYIHSFDDPLNAPSEDPRRVLGGKGRNLSLMRADLGLPVPPGFTIATEAWHAYVDGGWPPGLDEELREQMGRVELEVGRHFGGPGEPLLVSVRSGAAVSMPGMMDTILNLGLNDDNVDDLAEACEDAAFAHESHRRLDAMYRQIVGVDALPVNPWEQLRNAIEAVFRSWDTTRARAYRDREQISHDLGTAVTVQAMVFGNLDDNSGTGVLFTRDPASGDPTPYGDFLFRAQGEDVVAGTHKTESVQRLGERLPQVADELQRHSATLEHHFRDVCDIEFTVERGKLWLLQVRVGKRSPQAAMRFAVDMAEDDTFPLTRSEAVKRVAHHLADPPSTVTYSAHAKPVAKGLPASPGLATGRIATTADRAVSMAATDGDVVLVRPETSPDDVHGMSSAKGILTSRGGLTSHAAVVARGWGIPAVVGAESLEVHDGRVAINKRLFAEGEVITIDGQSGEIFAGTIEAETWTSPEARTLLGWAAELGIEIPENADRDDGEPPVGQREDLAPSRDAVLRALHIKGFATGEALAEVTLCSPEAIRPVVDRLGADGLIELRGTMFRLTDEGKRTAASLMGEDRDRWTQERASEALNGFLPLDGRMKEVVTAWQMRWVDGEQVMNDHTDERYDSDVIERLMKLHADAAAWLEPLTHDLERLGVYLQRLSRAASRGSGGDHAYIASPKIDSYHNVWFELHEDLIQLAGRTRESETQAGRA